MRNLKRVFTNKTGTGLSSEVPRTFLFRGGLRLPVGAKLALTYGTTITMQLQGLRVADDTWETLDEQTWTTGSPKYLHAFGKIHGFRRYRLNITANTDVTVDTADIGVGVTED